MVAIDLTDLRFLDGATNPKCALAAQAISSGRGFGDTVATISCPDETSAIRNLDASSHQPDKAIPLQHIQSYGHAFTMNTQHKRKELVGERHLVTSETVLRH